MSTNCRICGGYLETLLEYPNMPKAAQKFPLLEDLDSERGEHLEVCQCVLCGVVQLNNNPVPYYKEVIRAVAFSEEMKEFRTRQFAELADKHSLRGKPIIEIGCGEGEYLALMRDAGMDAYGIEYGRSSVRKCLDKGLKVKQFYIESQFDELIKKTFDCFFIMNFFEHLPDPNSTLKCIHHDLADDGVGIIEVPNFDMMISNDLFSEFISDHLFYYTKDTLTSVLERNGFVVEKCEVIWHDYIISATVRKRKILNLEGFKEAQKRVKKQIDTYISRYTRIATYGAGHQALAMLSLANMKGKVRYIVDDAPFKQGKYSPATHIPIVSNKRLKEDPVETIIIMAASYSDEVSNKLKRDFPDIDLAILRDFGIEKV